MILHIFGGLSWYICNVCAKRDGMAKSWTISRRCTVLKYHDGIWVLWVNVWKHSADFVHFFDVVAILIQWIWICLSPNHLCLNQQQACISCIKALQAMGSLPCWNSNNINRIERTQGFQPLSFQYALLSLEQYAKYCQIPFGWWLYKGPKYKDTIQYIVGYHNPWMDRQYQSAQRDWLHRILNIAQSTIWCFLSFLPSFVLNSCVLFSFFLSFSLSVFLSLSV